MVGKSDEFWAMMKVAKMVICLAARLVELMAYLLAATWAAYSASYLVASLEHRTAALKADHLEAKMAVM